MPKGLVAKPVFQQPKSKHHSYFEFVENKEKKKKLEFEVEEDLIERIHLIERHLTSR